MLVVVVEVRLCAKLLIVCFVFFLLFSWPIDLRAKYIHIYQNTKVQ